MERGTSGSSGAKCHALPRSTKVSDPSTHVAPRCPEKACAHASVQSAACPPPWHTAVTARDARALLQGRGGEEAKEADPAVEEEGDVDRGKAGLDEVLLGPKVRHRAVLRRNRNERLPGFEKYWKGMLTLSGGNVG